VGIGLYSGVSGLALGFGLYKGFSGLWSGASGLDAGVFPSLNLDFLTNTTLDPRITFSRTTNATLVDSTGRVTYAPNNTALYSEQFDNAYWGKVAATVTSNAAVAPNGTTTADKLVENTAVTTGHYINPSPNPLNSLSLGQSCIYSIYAKAGERTFIQLIATAVGPASTNPIAGFDLANGTAGTPSATVTSTITDVGDGWYRCSMAFPISTAAAATLQTRLALNSAAAPSSYTGDGTSGLFIWGAQFEQVTYQTLPSTYVQTVASAYYGPRFDYNPVTLAPRGLLIEEQRVNLLLRSEEFDNAGWTKLNGSVTANTTTSPDGTANADAFIENTAASAFHAMGQAVTKAASSIEYAGSFYVKDKGRQVAFNIQNAAGSSGVQGRVNPATGTVTQNATAFGSGFTAGTITITNAGNGWYRVVMTATSDTSTTVTFQLILHNGTTSVYTGDGVSGAFLYGAQLEAGAFATSYIPTVASTVTRAADNATITGTNFSSWYNASEGTVVVSADSVRPTSISPATRVFQFDDGTTLNNIRTGGTATLQVVDANVTQVNITATPAITFDGTVFKFASAYKLNDFATVTTGAVATDTSGTVPTVTQLSLGGPSTTGILNGHIRTFTFYPQRLTNVQLQELAAPPLVASLSLDFVNGTYQA
jgi:hypothetical protein